MRCAIYARVSTSEQTCDNQLIELRRYVEARGWTGDRVRGQRRVSGTKDQRPALDALMKDAKRRRFDVLVVWRLDRLGRNLKHLVTLLEDVQAVGIAFVSLGEGIDCTTAAGRLQLHVLAALAEFERARIAERVRAGLARVRASGKRLGPPGQLTWHRRPRADGSPVRPRRGGRPRRVALRRASGPAVPKTCRIAS